VVYFFVKVSGNFFKKESASNKKKNYLSSSKESKRFLDFRFSIFVFVVFGTK